MAERRKRRSQQTTSAHTRTSPQIANGSAGIVGCRRCRRAWHARQCVPVRKQVHWEVQEQAVMKEQLPGTGQGSAAAPALLNDVAAVSRVCQASAPWPG